MESAGEGPLEPSHTILPGPSPRPCPSAHGESQGVCVRVVWRVTLSTGNWMYQVSCGVPRQTGAGSDLLTDQSPTGLGLDLTPSLSGSSDSFMGQSGGSALPLPGNVRKP